VKTRTLLGCHILLVVALTRSIWGQAHGVATLDSGAVVRLHLDTATVTGYVLIRFTPESSNIVVCDRRQAPCNAIDGPGALDVPVASIRRLQVWGKETGFGSLMGLYMGGLIGASAHPPNQSKDIGPMLLGFVVGAAFGGVVGSKVTGWLPVFPCLHTCAAGEYPKR
jgi:hypothetical protein